MLTDKQNHQVSTSTHLSKLADIANALALESSEVCGDATVLEVHHASERLVEERPNRQHWEITSFGLDSELANVATTHQQYMIVLQPRYGSLP
jgi:hypothetical protein